MSGDALAFSVDPMQRIVPLERGSWRYPREGEEGLEVLVMPAGDPWGELIDLVAWEAARPGRWWRWNRAVTHLVDPRWLHGDRPLRLVEAPADWLRDRCEAVCILDWQIDVAGIFFGHRIVPESGRLRRKLAAALVAWPAVTIQ